MGDVARIESSTPLMRYEAACRAIAEAKAVDEVKQIYNESEAIRHYARQAENRTLEADAIEIRFRAERRLGEMILAQKETVGLHKGGRPSEKTCSEKEQVSAPAPVKLEDVGISRKLSSHAQKMASVPMEKFESAIASFRGEVASAKGRMTTDLLKVGEEEERRQARRDLAHELSDKAAEITGTRKYPAIYFDPPWKRKQGLTDRSYENHYPTMTWDEIVAWARQMAPLLLDDAWGFMWVPRAHMLALHRTVVDAEVVETGEIVKAWVQMPLAWAIAEAMGFDQYSTAYVWTKTDEEFPDDIGAGILVRDQDEILLMFKKGRGLPKPRTFEVGSSNHRERSKPLGHSRKPQHYRDMIARMTGGIPVLECFARHDEKFPLPPNWDAWGNQAQPDIPPNGIAFEAVECGDEQDEFAAGDVADLPDDFRIDEPPPQPVPTQVDDGLDIPAFLRRSSARQEAVE